MKVMIDIPKEFEVDLQDKFNEFFGRLIADIDFALDKQEPLLCGNYERETAEMFLSAFEKATIIPDDATNGEVLKIMFPNAQVVDAGIHRITAIFGDCHNMMYRNSYDENWWNAPYKKDKGE